MSTTQDPHSSDAKVGPHGAGDDGEDHGHDDHTHDAGEALGPVNTVAWGAGALGIVAGLITAFVLAIAAGWRV